MSEPTQKPDANSKNIKTMVCNCDCKPGRSGGKNAGPAAFLAFMAWIGAAVYFVNQVDGFWNIVLAILQSFVWPAYLIHNLLGVLNV